MLTGKMPFQHENLDIIVDQIKNANIIQLLDNHPYISQNARDFILTLLNRDIVARPSANQALLHAWF